MGEEGAGALAGEEEGPARLEASHPALWAYGMDVCPGFAGELGRTALRRFGRFGAGSEAEGDPDVRETLFRALRWEPGLDPADWASAAPCLADPLAGAGVPDFSQPLDRLESILRTHVRSPGGAAEPAVKRGSPQ